MADHERLDPILVDQPSIGLDRSVAQAQSEVLSSAHPRRR
jgi:hypothetical protein